MSWAEFVNDKGDWKGEMEPDICALLISMGSSHKASSKRSFLLKQGLNFPALPLLSDHHILTLDYYSPAHAFGDSIPSVCILAKTNPIHSCVINICNNYSHAECVCILQK